MFYELYFVIAILLIFYGVAILQVLDYKGFMTAKIILGFCIALVPVVYVGASIIQSFYKCKKLESGLVSIQTNAFVWRIVCITLLVAKQNMLRKNINNANDTFHQIYKGYTCELAQIACDDLYFKLHKIHEWLEEKENLKIKDLTGNLLQVQPVISTNPDLNKTAK
jgi:hypothetical protein